LRVDFYVVERGDADTVACRLADKAFGQGLRVFIRTGDPERTRRLDDLLWTFHGQSFVPHAPQENAGPEMPVVLGEQAPDGAVDLVINLADRPPESPHRYQRVAEVVGPAADDRRAARERFRYYRDELGREPETHRIRS